MPNDTTTAVQHPPKAHLGLPTISWFRPSSFDKHSCPYVGQWISPTHPGHCLHYLTSTTFIDREQRLLSRVITNASSRKPHAPSVTCNLPKLRPHMERVLQYNSRLSNGSINPGHALSTQPRQGAASCACVSRRYQRLRKNPKSEKNSKSKIQI